MNQQQFVWTPRHVAALAALCLAQVLDGVDVTVVNVALPVIKDDLGFDQADLAWVINAYMVPFGGLLLLGGRLGDLLGHRRILMGGIALFTLASLIAGLAPNATTLIAARSAQGVGAAMIAPMTLALIALIFPEGRPRSRAFAVWGAATGISATLGLFAGGLLTDGPGWRWIFFINLPIGVLLLLSAPLLRRFEDVRRARTRSGFDLVGAATSTVGVGLLAYTILQTDAHGWGSARTLVLLLLAGALLGYFVFHETRVAANPLLDLSLFRNRSVSGANAIQALRGGAMFAVFYFVTLYLQDVLGYSALETGLMYLPLTAVLIAGAGLGPIMVRWAGARIVIAGGSLVAAGGLLLFTGLSPTSDLASTVVMALLVTGLGFGVVVVPLTTVALSGVPGSYSGVASALLNVSAQLGGALGLAAISAAAVRRTRDEVEAGAGTKVALTEGFSFGFAISAGVMVMVVIVAMVVLRKQGKGRVGSVAHKP